MMPSKETFIKFREAVEEYEKVFGKDAYARMVPLVDPLHPDDRQHREAISKLKSAVASHKKLPELDMNSDLEPKY